MARHEFGPDFDFDGNFGGFGAPDQLGREFIVDDRLVRLASLPGAPGRGPERIDLTLGGGTIPGVEGTADRLVFVDAATGQPITEFQSGAYFSPGLRQWIEIDASGNSRPGGIRSLPFDTGTGSGGGLTFGQRRQLSQEERAFEAGENRIQREHELRTRLLSDVADMQVQARALIADRLGRDEIRGGILAQGALPVGRTPSEAFLLNLRETALDPVSQTETTEQLQSRVLRGLPDEPLQLAGGGEIRPGETALVGERGPEVLTFEPDGRIKVTPLSRSFAHGGEAHFDPVAQATLLAPIFEAAGIEPGVTPLATRVGFGQLEGPLFGRGVGLPTPEFGQAQETFSQLGVSPRLFQPSGSGEVFFLDPASNELRPIEGGFGGAVNTLGFQPRDITVLPRSEIGEFGQFGGEPLTALPTGESAGRVPFASSASPIFAAQDLASRVGLLLPQPRQLAAIWRSLDPNTQSIVKKTYGLAGIDEAQFDREIQFFSRAGTQQPSTRFG